jgi:hypothetical protein
VVRTQDLIRLRKAAIVVWPSANKFNLHIHIFMRNAAALVSSQCDDALWSIEIFRIAFCVFVAVSYFIDNFGLIK